jgi:catechol 2,3-dioxygenase-like lactoylglutathione lyase family enzyme
MNVKQEEHQLGFLSEGFLPIRRISGAPGPEKGAAQSLQRGSCGISLKTRRPARSLEWPRLRRSRQNSSFSLLGGASRLTTHLGSHGQSSKATRVRDLDRVACREDRVLACPTPARGIQHVDVCVRDVSRSLAFYLGILGPLGLEEDLRVPSYRGTEEVVYLRFGEQNLGLRPADGGEHTYYGVGIEHLAFEVERREEVDEAFERCRQLGARIHYPPEEDRDLDEYYAFFVFDPDGFRIEVFCAKAAESAESRWTPRQP